MGIVDQYIEIKNELERKLTFHDKMNVSRYVLALQLLRIQVGGKQHEEETRKAERHK